MNKKTMLGWLSVAGLLLTACSTLMPEPVATGDLGVIIERADGSVLLVNTTRKEQMARIEGLGDLSHASMVFSRDERYAFVFGRDGGLTKVDLLRQKIVARTLQAGNSIGGAISQDGTLVAVSNYTPGGVKVFSTDTLELVADIPATYADGNLYSKTVGLVDAPGQRFVFSLYDAGEIWIADFSGGKTPEITRFRDIGKQPYDALTTPDGHYYIAGLFGEDGLALLDLWHPENGVKRILSDYGRGSEKMPVYKMPHLEGWAIAGDRAFIPAVGRNEVIVMDMHTWRQVGSIPVYGQPVFVMARPDNRQIWVNFAMPYNNVVQVIDAETQQVVHELKPGMGVLHMEFTSRGEHVWLSVRDIDRIHVYDTQTMELIRELPALKPSGIFFTARAHEIGF